LIWLGAALVAVLAVMAVASLVYLHHQAVESGEDLTESLAQVVEEQTARTLQSVDLRLQSLVVEYQRLSEANQVDQQATQALLRRALADLPFARGVFIMNAQGQVVVDSGLGNAGGDGSDRDYFRMYREQSKAGLWIGPAIVGRKSGQPVFPAVRPIYSANNTFEGVAVAALAPGYFDRVWRNVPIGEGGVIALFRKDGTLIVRSPPLKESVADKNVGEDGLFKEDIARSATGTFMQTSAIDGVHRFIAYRTVTTQPDLVVIVGRSYEVAMQEWTRFAWLAVSIFVIASVATVLLSLSLQRTWNLKHEAEMQQRQLADRLSVATDAAAIGVWDWNIATGDWFATPTYFTMLGYDPEAGRKHHEDWLNRVHPDERQAIAATVDQVFAGQSDTYEFEPRMRHSDGSYRWVNLMGFVLGRDKSRRPTRIVGVKIDITDRKTYEIALHETNQSLLNLNETLEQRVQRRTSELRAAMRELDSFSYAVAHDLRAPLRGIHGFSSMLEESLGENVPADAANALSRIKRAAGRMGELIDDLLRLSRISRSEMVVEKCDIAAMARTIAEDLAQRDSSRRVEFVIPDRLDVMADRQLVRVLLENLIGNAWKFTSKQQEARIEVGEDVREGVRVCYVRDNGAGFDMAYAAKLFEPFQRLHSVGEFPGSGIGLATVARIVSRHGGRIEGVGAVGRGATFYFTLSPPRSKS